MYSQTKLRKDFGSGCLLIARALLGTLDVVASRVWTVLGMGMRVSNESVKTLKAVSISTNTASVLF